MHWTAHRTKLIAEWGSPTKNSQVPTNTEEELLERANNTNLNVVYQIFFSKLYFLEYMWL